MAISASEAPRLARKRAIPAKPRGLGISVWRQHPNDSFAALQPANDPLVLNAGHVTRSSLSYKLFSVEAE